MKYKCLVLDHDDTVVNSTATVHYPCFVEYTKEYFPDKHFSLEEYFKYNFEPGVIDFFRNYVGMSDEQMLHEQQFWNAYVKKHTPKAYDGIREILIRYRMHGGIICVVSHSISDNIIRDYSENDLPMPDMIFGWDSPPEQRKPNAYPLIEIMKRYSLNKGDLLMIDDLKPGFDMASSCGVEFAAAGWANDIETIERYMRRNSDLYFKTVKELSKHLFDH